MERKRFWKLSSVFIALFFCLSALLPAETVHAEAENVSGFVMDAEMLSTGEVGILFVRGGYSSGGAVSGGTLWYAVYNPVTKTWNEEPAGGLEVEAKEAALAISGDKAHIAYTTDDDKIAYVYQTDEGWSLPTVIESNNAGDVAGSLSAPDISIDSDGHAHITYYDTKGSVEKCEDGKDFGDGMYATNGNGSFEKSVVVLGYGQYQSGSYGYTYYRHPLSPSKITCTGSGKCVVMKYHTEDREGNNGTDKANYILFREGRDNGKDYEINADLFDVYSMNDSVYALVYGDNAYFLIQYDGDTVNPVPGTSSSAVGNYAADMTVTTNVSIEYNDGTFDTEEGLCYAAMSGNTLLYQDSYVFSENENKYCTCNLENTIHTSHNKLAIVDAEPGAQVIFTNTDGNIVIASPYGAYDGFTETLPTGLIPEDVSSVTFTATGYDSGEIGGLSAGAEYVVSYPTADGVSEDSITLGEDDDVIEVTELDTGTLTVIKKATTDMNADSAPKEFTITRADTPSLVATQPSIINGRGSIPATDAHEIAYNDPGLDPDQAIWNECDETCNYLTPGTYYVRLKADGTVLASAPQAVTIEEFVPEKEPTPEVTFVAYGEQYGTFTGCFDDDILDISGGKYGTATFAYSSDPNVTSWFTNVEPGTLSVVRRGNGKTTVDSDPQYITVTRAEKPQLDAVNSTTIEGNGSIPTTTAYEYRSSLPIPDNTAGLRDNLIWASCTGETTGLAAGTYYVRVKASGTVLASEPQEITIKGPVREATPNATFSATGDDSGLLSGLEDGAKYTATLGDFNKTFTASKAEGSDDVTEKLTGISAGTLSLVRNGDGGVTTVDSIEQKITVTKGDKPNLTAVNPSNRGRKGSIPTTTDQEMTRKEPTGDDPGWTACTGELNGLEEGTFYVRIRPDGTRLASEYQTIVLNTQNTWYVTFDAKGHGTAPAQQEVTDNTAAAEPPLPPLETGYSFDCWCREDGSEWNFSDPVTEDMTLYAKWWPHAYHVKFHKNNDGATGDDYERGYQYGPDAMLDCCLFGAPENMEFLEWNTKPDGSGTSYPDMAKGSLASENGAVIELYAQWTLSDWGDLAAADIEFMKREDIRSRDVPDRVWIGIIEPVTYTGSDITLSKEQLHVYDCKKLLVPGQDYTVKYENNKNVNNTYGQTQSKVTVTGKGNYDKVVLSNWFVINPKNFDNNTGNEFTCSNTELPYKPGQTQTFKPVIKFGKITLKEGTDYELSDNQAEAVGSYNVKVDGKGNYEGTFYPTCVIYDTEHDLSKAEITIEQPAEFTYGGPGQEFKPTITVKIGETVVQEYDAGTQKKNYDRKDINNDKAGKATITITGNKDSGKYCGTKSITYEIKKKVASDATPDDGITVSVADPSECVFTGAALKPAVTVKHGEATVPSTDYTVAYKNNTKVAAADATDKKGNDIAPAVTVRFKGSNYSGSKTVKFAITPRALTAADLVISVPDVKLNKATDAIKIKPTVKYGKKTLKQGTDYEASFEQVNGSVYVAKIKPIGSYVNAENVQPEDDKTFDVLFRVYTGAQDDISKEADFDITLSRNAFTYTGAKITPAVTVKAKNYQYNNVELPLVEGRDFTVTYSNNVNVPKNANANTQPAVTVRGKGAYKGSRKLNFTINPINLSALPADQREIIIPDLKWTGRAQKAKVTVKVNGVALKAADFDATFANTEAPVEWQATATINGKGNYTGTLTQDFHVYKTAVSSLTFAAIAEQQFTGRQITPGLGDADKELEDCEIRIFTDRTKVNQLVPGADYKLSWGTNVNKGSGTVIVTGLGEYGGTKSLTFKITPRKTSQQ